MGFRVNTNTSALRAHTALGKTTQAMQETTAKMAAGTRITKAADDAAGLAISEKMKAHIRSGHQANRNANDGISLIQVAEGGLNESTSIITRMRELSIQAASDTVSDDERAMVSMEYEGLKHELDRIAASVSFNGKKLLDGSGPRLSFKVGVGHDTQEDEISFEGSRFNGGSVHLGIAGASVLRKHEAQMGLAQLDGALDKVSGQRALLGSLQNRLLSSSNNLGVYNENMSASNSRIRDLDYAEEASKQAKQTILSAAGTAVYAQANTSTQGVLKLLS
jgi:flagellin